MKNILFVIFLMATSSISFAQLNDDGKSNNTKKLEQVGNSLNNTLLFSAAIPFAPFGLRYQYLNKSVGLFLNIKSDLGLVEEDFIISAGPCFRINNKINWYIGGGYNIGYEDIDAEAGVIIKWNKFSIDIGGGYSAEIGYGTLGFGFNF